MITNEALENVPLLMLGNKQDLDVSENPSVHTNITALHSFCNVAFASLVSYKLIH